MSIVVFWVQRSPSEMFPGFSEPKCRTFDASQLTEALTFCHEKRGEPGCHHVSLCSENPDSVGKPGVDSIVDGKTPDGHDYTWMKRRSQ